MITLGCMLVSVLKEADVKIFSKKVYISWGRWKIPLLHITLAGKLS